MSAFILRITYEYQVRSQCHPTYITYRSSTLRWVSLHSDSAADFAHSIAPTGSYRMKFKITSEPKSQQAAASVETKPLIQHEPDMSFGHKDAKYPQVVI